MDSSLTPPSPIIWCRQGYGQLPSARLAVQPPALLGRDAVGDFQIGGLTGVLHGADHVAGVAFVADFFVGDAFELAGALENGVGDGVLGCRRPSRVRPSPNPRCGSAALQDWIRRLPDRKSSRSEEHTSELQSLAYLVCRLLLEKNSALFHVGGDGPDRTLSCRFSGFSTLPTTGGFFDRSSV